MATRKRRTREHIIADLGVNYVERQVLKCGHAVNRTSPGQDYGVDLVVLTFDENCELENGQIEIQVRATEQVKPLKSGEVFAQRLETAHVSHWVMQPFPVILAVYDASQERAWWLNIQQAAEQRQLDDLGESVTVHLPFANEFTESAVEQFRADRDVMLKQLQQSIANRDQQGDSHE
ncbi:MAG: DUF4365 domain-containing protein [Planctomycetota bacterium]|nr:DUF4365 domain-containing protein [Planctomycetota bacterium]